MKGLGRTNHPSRAFLYCSYRADTELGCRRGFANLAIFTFNRTTVERLIHLRKDQTMKFRSTALHHSLSVFCKTILIVAVCASCVPVSPTAPVSSQPDRAAPLVEDNLVVKADPFPASQSIAARSAAPADTFQPANPLNSTYARVVDQIQAA